MKIMSNDVVVYEGKEIEVKDVHGDVIVLADNTVVSVDDVSFVKKGEEKAVNKLKPSRKKKEEEIVIKETKEEEDVEFDKEDLRNAIESLCSKTPISDVVYVASIVDPKITIDVSEKWSDFRSRIVKRALALGKIDPKVCNHCGQVIKDV